MNKIFSKQFKECQKDGTLVKIDATELDFLDSFGYLYNHKTKKSEIVKKSRIILVCLKFKTICMSKVCKHLRINI